MAASRSRFDTQPVRVLVVDDSAYMRYTLGKYLAEAPGMVVVGTARDGCEALALIPKLDPDVVTLDVEMPHLDGLSTLREIMAAGPRPVVMVSSLTTKGAHATIQALTLGAVDFVAKPSAKANVAAIADEVVAKIRAAAGAQVRATPLPARPPAAISYQPSAISHQRPLTARDKVIVIGASTGGPRALNAVMAALPADLPAAMMIVQHMPVGFTRSLAERLNSVSAWAVKEAETGDRLQVGRALLAPGGFHMALDGSDQIALNQNPAVHGVRPAVDVTMSAVARRYASAAVGVVLTGMGQDGTHGAALIHSAGGRVIAEAESTCVVWGMPRSVVEAGAADAIAPLPDVPEAIEQAVRTG